MTIPDRYLDLIPWAIATLFIAGIVHIVSVLLMPTIAPRDAYARLAAVARKADPAQGVVLLPPPAPGAETLPFEDPVLAEAACVYDLSNGLLRVRATTEGDEYLGVSFHASAGRIYHAMTDRSAIKGKIDIVVGDPKQISALEAEDESDAPPQEVRLTAPTKRGFVLFRSFAKRASDQERARERLATVKCERFELAKAKG